MFEPWFYQHDCLRIFKRVRQKGVRKALAVMASGLGKTVTMAFDALAFRKEFPKARVLYLCHQNQISYQTRGTFEAVNGSECTYGFYNGVEKTAHSVDFLFASFQTMRKHIKDFRPDEFDYIVVDESHHIYGDTFIDVVTYWKPQFLLGMTATPDRSDGQDIRKVFGKEVFCLPLEEALAQNLLTPVDYRMITDEIQLEGKIKAGDRRLSINKLNRSIFIPKRDEEIIRIIQRHAKEIEQPQIILFCQSVSYCDRLMKIIPGAMAIHSGVPLHERMVRTELFRQGLINILLTVDCFNEGIDLPEANLIVFLRVTTSLRVFFQQLGRGLRLSKGKDKVIVLDFVSNYKRVKTIYELWLRIKELREHPKTRRALARQSRIGSPRVRVEPFIIDTERVAFEEKVLELLDLLKRINAEFYPTWQEASAAAIKLGIKTKVDYAEKYADDPRLPSSPPYAYSDFPKWRVFLGGKNRNFYTYKKASRVVQRMGIKTQPQYDERKKEDERLPGYPPDVYKDVWQGWPIFFGEEPREICRTWRIAARIAKEAGVDTKEDYLLLCDKDNRLPRDPWTAFKDFPGWPSFFKRKSRQFKQNPYKTWKQAARAAKKLGATTCALYQELRHKDPRLYADPIRVYKDCPDWNTFLGK
jgi:superfamily II DNA or RNA helicase